jgi:membrane fusion protein, multidrug efflux system
VKRGDLLFEIDPRLYETEVEKAKADFQRLEARAKRFASEWKRAKDVFANSGTSKSEYDRAESEHLEAEAAVTAGRATLALASLHLSFTKITAPIDGQLNAALVTPGNVVTADQTTLATMCSVDPMYVFFDVDERTLLSLNRSRREGKMKAEFEKGLPIRVGLIDETGFPHEGKVDIRGVVVDPAKGTPRLRGALRNLDGLLLPGLFARVRMMTGSTEKRLWVPTHAFKWTAPKPFLWVVNAQNIVERRDVEVRSFQDQQYNVIEGLSSDDWVVLMNPQDVKAGSVVRTEKAKLSFKEKAAFEDP